MKTMKTKIISKLKKELLLVEAKDEKIAWAIIFQKYGVKAVSDYTILGTPDEIKEDDVHELIPMYYDYAKTAVEYIIEALESEIFWTNPHGKEPRYFFDENVNSKDIKARGYHNMWHEAQEKTFDRNRSIILVKN